MPITRTCPRAFLPRSKPSGSPRYALYSHTSRQSVVNPSSVPVSPSPGESYEAISPYPFKPYNQTSVDTISSSRNFTSLSFSLPPEHLPHALNRLEGAVLRLIDHYPFLTGNVSESSHGASTLSQADDAFQIQPVTASLMQHIPMLQTQHHAATGAFSPSDHTPSSLLPLPILSPPTEPSPALRCKANVLGTRLVLVFGWDTRVMDPGGAFAVVRMLAEFCRDPGAAREEIPVPDPWAQVEKNFGNTFNGLGLSATRWTTRDLNASRRGAGHMAPSQEAETRTARLNEDKIALLTDACNLLVGRVASDACPGRLDQNDVVSAAVGVCGSRARYHPQTKSHSGSTADAETISVSADLRNHLPLSAASSYMGNATVSIPVPVQSPSLPLLGDSQMRSLLPDISPRDFYRVCNLAVSLRGRIHAIEKGGEETDSACGSDKWASRSSMRVNTLRPMDFNLDFGPLGRVLDVNVPGTRENGTCWVLPEKEQGGWDVTATVEPQAMQKLRGDRLVRWMIDGVNF